MRKSTFCGLVVFCGLGSLFFGVVFLNVFGSGCGGSSKHARVGADFSSIASAIKLYTVNNHRPPSTDQGLRALVDKPVSGPKPKRWSRITGRVPLDPWMTPYRYQTLPPTGPQWRWELRSAGPDTVFGSSDDLADEFESGFVNDPLAEPDEELEVSRPSF